jgi:hypothetical protein
LGALVSYANASKELMSDNEQALYEIVLINMADDYESFEYLLEHAQQWASENGVSVTRDAIAAALGRAIREGDAKAYLLSSRPPHSQVVEFSLDRIDDLWYYVTPKGKRTVAQS